MRDPQNIIALQQLNIDIMGLIFWQKSSRCIKNINVNAGTIPDLPCMPTDQTQRKQKRAGVFVDEMIQTIITDVYNYNLDYIQLHGNESPTYIDNLKRTLIPDIQPDIKIIKALGIRETDDVKRWREYEGYADILLFDTKCDCKGGSGKQFNWSILNNYDGDIPFLLSGGIGPEDAEAVKEFHHPMCIGIDINSKFETSPGLKDIEKIKTFIQAIRNTH